MTRQVTLPAGATPQREGAVRHRARLGLRVSHDQRRRRCATNLSTNTNPNGQNFGNGITGSSAGLGRPDRQPSAYAGTNRHARLPLLDRRCRRGAGFSGRRHRDHRASPRRRRDRPRLGLCRVLADRRPRSPMGFFNAYFAEYRNYSGYDDGLRTGPYNFGFLNNTKPAELGRALPVPGRSAGLVLRHLVPGQQRRRRLRSGRCGGLYLPVDAHPDLLLRPDNGNVWRPRVPVVRLDLRARADRRICLNANDTFQGCYGGLAADPLFDDTQNYWVAPNPAIGHFGWSGVPCRRRVRRSAWSARRRRTISCRCTSTSNATLLAFRASRAGSDPGPIRFATSGSARQRRALRPQQPHPAVLAHAPGLAPGLRAESPEEVRAHRAANRASGVLRQRQALQRRAR